MDSNAFDVVLARADAYREEVYATCGDPPTHFIVTNAEYLVLLRSDDHLYIHRSYTPDCPMRLMGMVVCTARAWCPEMKALQQRAYAYATQHVLETGDRPHAYLVSQADYELLVRHELGGGEIHLWGMWVRHPERMLWSRGASSMRHISMSRPIPLMRVDAPIPIMTDMAAQTCSTPAPRHVQHEVVCPCGEVIWELSACEHSWSPRGLDSETTPMDDWEVGVRRMIAEARRHHVATPRSGG